MTEGEWMKKVFEVCRMERYDVGHIVELLSEAPVPLFMVLVTKVVQKADDWVCVEWSRHFHDVQNAAGFLFNQCELFNNRIRSLYYSNEVRMISINIEGN